MATNQYLIQHFPNLECIVLTVFKPRGMNEQRRARWLTGCAPSLAQVGDVWWAWLGGLPETLSLRWAAAVMWAAPTDKQRRLQKSSHTANNQTVLVHVAFKIKQKRPESFWGHLQATFSQRNKCTGEVKGCLMNYVKGTEQYYDLKKKEAPNVDDFSIGKSISKW